MQYGLPLRNFISASSKTRIMQVRVAFQTIGKGSLSIMEYILKLKTLTNNLATIREPITERDQILQHLGGLGADYDSI